MDNENIVYIHREFYSSIKKIEIMTLAGNEIFYIKQNQILQILFQYMDHELE